MFMLWRSTADSTRLLLPVTQQALERGANGYNDLLLMSTNRVKSGAILSKVYASRGQRANNGSQGMYGRNAT